MKILYLSLLAGTLVVSVMSSGLSARAADVQVLYFVDAEIAARLSPLRPVLNITSAAGKTIQYTETDAIENEKGRLGDFHIVWLGFNAISDNGNNHIAGVEQALLDYTSAGGMVFSESPDNDGFQDNWLPSPISGVEDAEHTNVEATDAAGDLFKFPNEVNLTGIQWDDNFINYDETQYNVLAEKSTKDRAEILMIRNGDGLYLVSSVDSRVMSADLENLCENVLTFFLSALAVQPAGKLSAVWGEMKSSF